MYAAFDALGDDGIAGFAHTLLAQGLLSPSVRNQVQDLVWADEPEIKIPKRQRRELARALQSLELFRHWEHFERLIHDTFILLDDVGRLFFGAETGLIAEIHRHFVCNPEDADVEWLFEQLQVFDLSERRFCVIPTTLASTCACRNSWALGPSVYEPSPA